MENKNDSILFLHGFTQNSEVFNKRSKPLIKEIEIRYPNTKIIIPDAPHLLESDKLGWFYLREDDKLNCDDFYNDEVIYKGFTESINLIEKIAQENNIKCIIGFSQGSLLTIFISLLIQNEIKYKKLFPDLKCVIVISGFIEPKPLNDEISKYIIQGSIEIPSLFIYGEKDEYISAWKSENASLLYEKKEIYKHDGKHFIPVSKRDIEIYMKFLNNHLS